MSEEQNNPTSTPTRHSAAKKGWSDLDNSSKVRWAGLGVVVLLTIGLLSWGLTSIFGSDESESDSLSKSTYAAPPSSIVDPRGAQGNLPNAVVADNVDGGPGTITIGEDSGKIVPVDLNSSGVLTPPRDVTSVGWYVNSTIPGSGVGSVVVTGHINDAEQGTGFAGFFTTLKTDDIVTIKSEDGASHLYRVTAAPYHSPKELALPISVNDSTGPERLILITCGGQFVGGEIGYQDNIIVEAVPV